MSLVGENILLRVYLRSADRFPHIPAFQQLIKAARLAKLAGATILQGIAGAGYHEVSRAGVWHLLDHAPIIVEIVDTPEKIGNFARDHVNTIVRHGLATLERAAVMMYRHRDSQPSEPLRLADILKPLSTVPTISTESTPAMENILQPNSDGTLLRIFVGESDRFDRLPLHEAILQKVRELGLAGATVLRGIEGYGARSVIHKSNMLDMSTDLPLVIEIVDYQEKVALLLPHLESMVHEGMMTMEHVRILLYRSRPGA